MSGLLVIRGGAMGDFLLTLPALRLLREEFPGQRIELLSQPGLAGLARDFGLVDGARPLESAALARFFVRQAALDKAWCAYFAAFSVIVSHLFDPDDVFHDNLARAGAATVLRGPSKPAENGGHAALQLARPLEDLALFLADTDWQRPFRNPIPGAHAPIALHPGSGSPRKNWGLDNWRRVARDLHRAHDASFLLVSGEAESSTIGEFCAMLETDAVPFDRADQLPLTDLFAWLSTCRLFLGHDTGPAHLAAAAGLPCVLVFGPSDPAVWAPPGEHVIVVREPGGSLAALAPHRVTAAATEQLGVRGDPTSMDRPTKCIGRS